MEFLVNDVSEECFIVSKVCCPQCKSPKLKIKLQELLELRELPETLRSVGASGMADRLTLECMECGFRFTLLFHLHQSYVSKLSSIAERLSRLGGHLITRVIREG